MRIAVLVGLLAACGKTESTSSSPPPPVPKPAPAPGPAPAPKPVDTTSSASPVWKPGPKVVAASTVDGAALRTRHRERLATDKSPVTVLTGGTPLELGQRLCEAAVPKRPA
jgi:hypothetical protein